METQFWQMFTLKTDRSLNFLIGGADESHLLAKLTIVKKIFWIRKIDTWKINT